MKNYLSVDIGGTNTKFAEFNNAGNIIKKEKIQTPHEKNAFLSAVDKVVKKYADQGVKGLAFCAPGKIVKATVHFGGALPFLDGIDFAKRYEKFGIPVAVINDGKASALAENWLGNLKDMKNCASITLGTEIGGGIIVNGRLLNGAHYQAGEVSFFDMDMNKKDFEGFSGTMGSAVGMIKRVNKALNNPNETDGLAAFKAINDGNEEANKIFNEFCRRIAVVILNMQATVDLDTIAIGGGISAQPIVIKGINKAYDSVLNENPIVKTTFTRPKIVAAKFQNDANLFGALYNLLLYINGEKL